MQVWGGTEGAFDMNLETGNCLRHLIDTPAGNAAGLTADASVFIVKHYITRFHSTPLYFFYLHTAGVEIHAADRCYGVG